MPFIRELSPQERLRSSPDGTVNKYGHKPASVAKAEDALIAKAIRQFQRDHPLIRYCSLCGAFPEQIKETPNGAFHYRVSCGSCGRRENIFIEERGNI